MISCAFYIGEFIYLHWVSEQVCQCFCTSHNFLFLCELFLVMTSLCLCQVFLIAVWR